MEYFKTTEHYNNIECVKLYDKYYYISLYGLYQITNNATYSRLLMKHAKNRIVIGQIEANIVDTDEPIKQNPAWKRRFKRFVAQGGLKGGEANDK